MKKKIALFSLGAALITVPVLAQQVATTAPAATDKNQTLTRADAEKRATELFAKLDVNKDGKLDAADRAAARAAQQDARFKALDADGNGSISRAEWDKNAADRAAKRAEWQGKRGERGAEAGAPGEGPHHRMGGRGGKRGGHGGFGGGFGGWGKGDADGDKAITLTEFKAAALARFDRLDANKDGKVTPEERKAGRPGPRGDRGAPPAAKPAA